MSVEANDELSIDDLFNVIVKAKRAIRIIEGLGSFHYELLNTSVPAYYKDRWHQLLNDIDDFNNFDDSEWESNILIKKGIYHDNQY